MFIQRIAKRKSARARSIVRKGEQIRKIKIPAVNKDKAPELHALLTRFSDIASKYQVVNNQLLTRPIRLQRSDLIRLQNNVYNLDDDLREWELDADQYFCSPPSEIQSSTQPVTLLRVLNHFIARNLRSRDVLSDNIASIRETYNHRISLNWTRSGWAVSFLALLYALFGPWLISIICR
ncbi:hypothetical protein ACFL45_10380 [Candidatus Neomarinimicrobiota bacterium]